MHSIVCKKNKVLTDNILALWPLIIGIHLTSTFLYHEGYWEKYLHLIGITLPFPLLYEPIRAGMVIVLKTTTIFDYMKETSEKQAKSKQITIDFSMEPNLPAIYADSEKTAWVLINLINTAIQYSENGSRIQVVAS